MRIGLSLWHGVLGASLLAGLGVFLLYSWLPADGATGDLESFAPQGFRIQWLMEEREGGLRAGDLIVRAGGYTANEWLEGAPRGREWHTGGMVTYQILRDGEPMMLEVRLAPIPFRAVLARWAPQLIGALAFFFIGTFIFWKRPRELSARLMMFFCVSVALQYWGDAYNFQFAILPWRWPLWLHLAYEHLTYNLSAATACYFALVFPTRHPLVERFPRLVPFVLYVSHPIVILGVMAASSGYSAALRVGNHASLAMAMLQIGLAIGAGIRSSRIVRDPVRRTQVRLMALSGGIGAAVLFPGYILPLILTGHPLLPHPAAMILMISMFVVLTVAILRYRLFDIEIIVNRTLVYGTLTALLVGLYFLLVRSLTLLIQTALQRDNDTLAVFIAALGIALAFNPLRQRVQALIDRAFYRTKLDYQRLLPEMSERLATSIVPHQLASLLTEEVPKRLQIGWAELSMLDSKDQNFIPAGDGHGVPSLPADHPLVEHLRRLRGPLMRLEHLPGLPDEAQAFLERGGIELSIPLIVGRGLVGLYNLGPKLSGGPYNRYEVRLLHLLGGQAAVAVENSRLYADIKKSLEEKEVLLKEIHHRVKNNLQIVSSLLSLQSRYIKDKRMVEMLKDGQNRIKSMALVHEKLYQAGDLAKIDPSGYIRDLASYLLRSYEAMPGGVGLKVKADDVLMGIDTAIPCGLIISELVSNSLKHAFPLCAQNSADKTGCREDEIVIDLSSGNDGKFTLIVSDNGIGFPKDLDFRRTESMGLQLVNTLIDQIGGTIELDRRGGTEFKITFAEPKY